ncbi:ATPase [Marivirga lumbricoides]|uniref:ATPase n=1 Tax=Marivirga lumbricoides TaxID=1046115 RepID=A0A2T4DN85_9BACT|nr:ATPase [Marivirga lumbricoides]
MKTNPKEIYSWRILNFPVEMVYESFSNPAHLAKWWGPEGFTNTIHEFDLKPGGKWVLTMHGPEKGNYENAAVFKKVDPFKLISWTRTSKPLFDMEVSFEELSDSQSRIAFKMIFNTMEECEKIRSFAEPKNEENFDKLERLLSKMSHNKR